MASILDATMRATAQSAAMGALPTLMAATADLPGGDVRRPQRHRASGAARRTWSPRRGWRATREAARRLWEISEQTVGLSWP